MFLGGTILWIVLVILILCFRYDIQKNRMSISPNYEYLHIVFLDQNVLYKEALAVLFVR